MSREDPQLKIRLPPELKQRVEEASKANHRSLNAEIVARLELSFGSAIVVNYDLAIQQIRDLDAMLGKWGYVRDTPDPIDENSDQNPNRDFLKGKLPKK